STVEDSVDGTLDEMMYDKAFRKHPYRHPVIGHMTDIKAVTREKAVRFYQTYYAPNNAVVVVAGQFEADRVLENIVRGYGGIPAQSRLPADTIAPERAPVAAARIEID